MSSKTPDHVVRFRCLPGTAKAQESSIISKLKVWSEVTKSVQVIRNLHSEVMELNSELNILKKKVLLSERALEEHQAGAEQLQSQVFWYCVAVTYVR